MKKLIATLLIFFILCSNSYALVVGYSRVVVGPAGACSAVPTISNEITDFDTWFVGQASDSALSGGKLITVASLNGCEFDYNFIGHGDVDAYTYQLEHWTGGTSSSMGTLSSTSQTVSGASMPNDTISGYVTFEFLSSITVSNGDALLVTRTDHLFDGTNYLTFGYDYNTVDTRFFHLVASRADGVTSYGQNLSHALNIRAYEVE